MNDLENAVQPIFRPMMHGRDSTLSTSQQLTIAQWTIKTAINYEFMRERSPRFFKPTDRRAVFESRLIPNDTFIFLGQYLGNRSIRTFDSGAGLTLFPNTPKATKMDGYEMTLAVGHLVLQFFGFRRPEDHQGPISINVPGAWDNASFQVWPIRGNRQWPPVEVFDDIGVKLFAERWRTVTP